MAEDGTIVVRAQRLRGQLDVEDPPVLELDAEAIASLGAGSIDDILVAIEPATGSARGRGGGGRPVFLVNGVRIGSFREFRSYPPEAIAKVEVFNEEVAQRFGYSPDQRVVNFVLKNDFTSKEAEAEFEAPSAGGFLRTGQEFTLLTIKDGARINAQFEASQRGSLTEAERDLALVAALPSDVASDPDPREFRTLVGEAQSYQGEVSYAKAFIESGSSISLNLTANRSDSLSLSGLDSVLLTDANGNRAFRVFGPANPLERRTRSTNVATSGSYNSLLGDWQLTATFDAGWAKTRSRIDRFADVSGLQADALSGALALDGAIVPPADAGFDTANATLWNASSLATLRGTPLVLPGGEVSTTLDFGYDWDRIESDDTRSALDTRLTRGDVSAGINVNIPITSRREGFADALGSFTANAQAGINHLSDFGTLYDWTLGLTWAPSDNLTFSASRIWREVAPGLTSLGNPQIIDLNVPVFDFVNNESVLATVTSGGNPDLLAETQADWKFSANWQLPFWRGARLQADYAVNRSDDVTSGFPALTPAFEAAFPDRVERDANQRLIALDRRPVTLFETRSRTFSFSFNTGGSIGKRPEQPEGGGGPPPGVGGRPGGGGPPPGASGGGGGPPAGARGGGGRPPAGGMSFDREAMEQARTKFCATPEGETPDLTGLPEFILSRLRDENGNIPPERIAQLRERFCGEEAEQRAQAGGERFAAMRSAICADPPKLDDLPEQMLARLKNEDGEIDPERLNQLRSRMCGENGGQAASGGSGGPPQGGRRGGRGGGGFGGFFGGGNDPRPRYFLSLSHVFALENEVLVSPTGPLLDQLDGFVLGGGGVPEYSARLEAGLFFPQGYGMRLSGRYTGAAELRGNGLPGSTDLFFGDIATFDIRLFADLGRVFKDEEGVLKGARLSLRADNVFDARRSVTDSNGDTPAAFDPRRTDPIGRYLGIELRKVF